MSQKKKNPVATVCSLLGTILLIVLILGCIPLTVPKAFGYNIYTVISGIAQSLTTGSGKIALFCLIAFILLLEILGSLLHKVEFKK